MTQAIQRVAHLSAEAAQKLLESVPEYIRTALIERAAEINYPIEAVVEMAIASYLEDEALSFEDCLLAERINQAA